MFVLRSTNRNKLLLALALVALSDLGLLLSQDHSVRYVCAFALVLLAPGFGVARLILGTQVELSRFERFTCGLAAGYPVAVVATLLLHYVPGKPTVPLALLWYSVVAVVPWLIVSRTSAGWRTAAAAKHPADGEPRPIGSPASAWLGLVLLAVMGISAFFFFAHLGTAEFQGDEAMVMLDGGNALLGDDSALFYHRKGPAEVLLPMALWLLTGTVTEFMARVPFALAGLLSVVGTYLLARRALGSKSGDAGEFVGLAAAGLFAVNGYVVGFSRIVEYQSLVFLMSLFALLCAHLFCQSGLGRYQILSGLFLAGGLLAHYDALFVAPAVAYLYWRWPGWACRCGIRACWQSHRRRLMSLALAVVVFVGLTALFYVPFAQPQYFSQTFGYLAERAGTRLTYNNLPLWLELSITYNSIYYVAFLFLLMGALAVVKLSRLSRSLAAVFLVLAICGLAAMAFPAWWKVGVYRLAFIPFLIIAVLLIRAFRREVMLASAFIWFVLPFLFYNFFLVKNPGTHTYVTYPGLVLIAAHACDRVRQWLLSRGAGRKTLALGGTVVALALLLLFSYYIYTVFIRVYPEYRASYPASKSPLYWTPHSELRQREYFGMPHRAGWKAIGVLYSAGILQGEYDSNEGRDITAWYIPNAPQHVCKPLPRYYFVAQTVQDAMKGRVDEAILARHFTQVGLVTVDGRPGIRIYERGTFDAPVEEYALEQFEREFDRSRTPWNQLTKMAQFITIPTHIDFGEISQTGASSVAQLIGYDLDQSAACPGGQVVLTLYWRRAGPPIQRNYKVFVHMEKDGLWAQADDFPGCAAWPTPIWRAGEVVADRHVIELDRSILPDWYSLLVGLYEPETGTRLNLLDPNGLAYGDSLLLDQVEVRALCATVHVQTDQG